MPSLTELDESECVRLLRSRVVGRLGLVTDAPAPVIVPVNYAVVDGSIQLLTTDHGLVSRWATTSDVAFQVDQIDPSRWTGWSVLAQGPCELVPESEATRLLQQLPRPRPWADGDRRTLLRLRWTRITGRRLGGAAPETRHS
jgi:nitroimidazol reductase NimA-like FMN-containing flavoprotein (pyridoxamine 5'-phosphate oxidase superfamily)